jgi:hypothetical protein
MQCYRAIGTEALRMTRYRLSLFATIALPFALLVGVATLVTPSAAGPGDPTRMYALPPELVGDKWLNVTAKEHPALKKPTAKVTVIHFWTFG